MRISFCIYYDRNRTWLTLLFLKQCILINFKSNLAFVLNTTTFTRLLLNFVLVVHENSFDKTAFEMYAI